MSIIVLRRHVATACALLSLPMVTLAGIVPKEPPVEAIRAAAAVVADRLPTDVEKWTATSIPGTYFGISGARGSLLAGLLLGAVGVAGNVIHIQGQNRSRAETVKSLTSLQLAEFLKQSVPELSGPIDTALPSYTLIPSAYFYFPTDTTYYVGCTLNAKFGATKKPGDKPSWHARYSTQVDQEISSESESNDVTMNAIATCLQEAYRLFSAHVAGTLGSFNVRKIVMGNSALKLPVADGELPKRVVANDGTGIVEFRRSAVKEVK